MIFDFLKKNRKFLLVFGVLIIFFSTMIMSQYCWDCFNVHPELGQLNHTFPLEQYRYRDYKAPLFLSVPFVKLLGENLFAIRLSSSFFAAMVVLTTFFAGKVLRNNRTGLIASITVMLTPFLTLMVHSEYIYTVFFTTVTLLSWTYFIKNKTFLSAGLTGFITGLGIYQKFSLVYILIGLLIASAYFMDGFKKFVKEDYLKLLVLCLFLVIGSSHMIYSNIVEEPVSVEAVQSSFHPRGLQRFEDIGIRVRQLSSITVSEGNVLSSMRDGYSIEDQFKFLRLRTPFLFLLLISSVYMVYKRDREGTYIFIVFLTVLLLFTFIPRYHEDAFLNQNNMLNLVPLAWLMIASTVDRLLNEEGFHEKILLVLVLSTTSLILLSNVFSYHYYYSHVGDQRWVEENIPFYSFVHQEARIVADESLGEGFDKMSTRFIETGGTKIWTKGLCSSKILEEENYRHISITAECGDIETLLDCDESTDLVLPYPPGRKNGSDVWTTYYCRNSDILESSCMKPFIYFEELESEEKIIKETLKNIEDSRGKTAYKKIRIEKVCRD